MDKLEEEILDIISSVTKKPRERLTLQTKLFNQLRIDSLAGVELLAALDKRFDLDIPEDKIGEIDTIGDIVRVIRGGNLPPQ